ncbi:MAG: hypothetical protein P4L74_00570 [Candidatus Doudnabacteria bacterium]|nr:hypothetical protein [Candidatus Doudnabacteria bacterium]
MSNLSPISWEAHEFKYYPKTSGWYITLVAVFILLIAFFIIVESDYFAAVSLAIIGALIIIFARQTPQRVEIEINERGIRFGNLSYPYKQLKYFWIVNNDRHQTVNFHSSALVNNVVILELERQDPEEVRNFLVRFLPEHHLTQETTAQKIMHRFKF